MKTEIGYIYVLDGQVVANPRRSPVKNDHKNAMHKYHIKYKAWKANCIPVVNAEKTGYKDRWFVYFVYLDELYELTNGQKVEHINGEVKRIV